MLNKTILQGRLTKDIDLQATANGISYANFTIAWNEKLNEEKDTTLFLNCVAWRNTAEFLKKYFKKGDMLIVEGKLITEQYQQDGATKSITKATIDKIHFGGGGGQKDEQSKKEIIETSVDLPF